VFRVTADDGDVALYGECRTTNCVGVRGAASAGYGVIADGGGGTDSIGVVARGRVAVEATAEEVSCPQTICAPYAIQAYGATLFNRSGLVTIPAGAIKTTVVLGGFNHGPLNAEVKYGDTIVQPASLIFATPQERPDAGVFVRAVVPHPSTNSFTIYLNKVVAGGVKVGWFIVN
jgi:hypothetical protein